MDAQTSRLLELSDMQGGLRINISEDDRIRQLFVKIGGCWEGNAIVTSGLCYKDSANDESTVSVCCPPEPGPDVNVSVRFWEIPELQIPVMSQKLVGQRFHKLSSGHTLDLDFGSREASQAVSWFQEMPLHRLWKDGWNSVGMSFKVATSTSPSEGLPRPAMQQEVDLPGSTVCVGISGTNDPDVIVMSATYHFAFAPGGESGTWRSYACPDKLESTPNEIDFWGRTPCRFVERVPMYHPTRGVRDLPVVSNIHRLQRVKCPATAEPGQTEQTEQKEPINVPTQKEPIEQSPWLIVAIVLSVLALVLVICCAAAVCRYRRMFYRTKTDVSEPDLAHGIAVPNILEVDADPARREEKGKVSHSTCEETDSAFPQQESPKESDSKVLQQEPPRRHDNPATASGVSRSLAPSELSSFIFKDMDTGGVLGLAAEEHLYLHSHAVEILGSDPIGSGGFGQVFRGCLYTHTPVAVKLPFATTNERFDSMSLFNEVRLFRRIRHPNVVLFHGVTYLNIKCLALVLEWIDGGDFHGFILRRREDGSFEKDKQEIADLADGEKPSLDECKVLKDVALGMQYIHMHDVLHLDLKPRNILVQIARPVQAKITDFGLSKLLNKETGQHQVGTLGYMAPEIRQRKSFGKPADVFSYACVVAFALNPTQPEKKKDANASKHILEELLREEEGLIAPMLQCVRIALRCVQADPALRPTFNDILQDLREESRDFGQKFANQQTQPEVASSKMKMSL
eukprot:TRINITY_DN9438_c0_g1_i1.p1 TRINITY_DN9438_c0_g1~~TRINITY_DN9438_c0_g1_i1.p1  ORF type:complete len:740 (+),score=127.67 TRINITY_DN9438_c0_g1_i1:177-2396(+)